MEPDWQGLGSSPQAAGRNCSSDTIVKGTGVVPSYIENIGKHPIPDTTEEGYHYCQSPKLPPKPQLAVWTISGNKTMTAKIQKELQNYLHQGGRSPPEHTTPSLQSQSAVVMNGTSIPCSRVSILKIQLSHFGQTFTAV